MKRLNNKGLTLIELIISVVLISIVMLFMYGVFNDVNNEKNDNSFAKDNQVNRSEIIKVLEDDLLSRSINISSINDFSTDTSLKFDLYYSDGKKATIEATETTFSYTNADGLLRKWTMKDSTINYKKANVFYNKSNTTSADEGIYSLLINIEVYTDNDNNRSCSTCTNNVVDDIIISYVGDNNISNVKNCLGKGC